MLHTVLIEDIVRAALREDLGHGRDITSESLIPADTTASARLTARQRGILAGLLPALTAFSMTDPGFEFAVEVQDGGLLTPDMVIAEIEGPARALLIAERTALNILTMMSGTATLTAMFVDEIEGTAARICDTRKTLPGLRSLQKYAVRMGGGFNHRHGLDDAVLIKDNHIALCGGVKQALEDSRARLGHMVKIAVEVDTLKQLEQVLKTGLADSVLLDNMDPAMLAKAVAMARGALVTEASGGVTLDNVAAIAETGVDYISIGALTHSAPALDIGLDIAE